MHPKKHSNRGSNNKTFLDKCIRNPEGIVTIGQAPNLPQIVGITAWLISMVVHGNMQHSARIIAFGALFTWGWLELFQGVNYLRRAMGLTVLSVLFITALKL